MSSLDQPSHNYITGASANHAWSATFEIIPPMPKDEVVSHLGRLVVGYGDPSRPISGAVIGTGDTDRTELVLGLDPSRTHGTPSVEQCEIIAEDISDKLGWQRQAEEPFGVRAIMGRRIGYDETAHTYSSEEVRALAEAAGRSDLNFVEGDLFSLRPMPNQDLWQYDEPGVIITGSADAVDTILEVAEIMEQDRVVPEIPGVGTQVYQIHG